MTHAQYIGRIGALAVALGIGAAVATNPGIAPAQDTDSGSVSAGAGAPSGTSPENPAAQTSDVEASDENEPGGSGPDDITPPEMNVAADTTDTSTHDGASGAEAGEEDAVDEDAEELAGEESPANEARPQSSSGSPVPAGTDSLPQHVAVSPQPEPEKHTVEDTPAPGSHTQRKAVAGPDDGASAASFTTVVDDVPAPAPRSEATPVTETRAVVQNPISALITLPLRIIGEVLSAFVGGPNTPSGENPLVLGILAFVRRQFSTFERTFSNNAPVITGAQVDENTDGTFTITVDIDGEDAQASDPDGDALTFSATGGPEGTIEKTGANTFRYTPGADFDGDDVITITASDPGGLFGINRKTATVAVDIEAGEDDPTQPEDPDPPTQQDDGTVEQTLQFDPAEVVHVTIAPGFEPKYYIYEETYNEETGEYELILTPTQAGMLRAALGLDTTDSVGLQVTTVEAPQTVQTFSMRSMSFAAAAEEPDYVLNLPDLPSGRFVAGAPIVTSPGADDPEATNPAGTVVTDRYTYVLNSNVFSGNSTTLAVFGADPDEADYLQLVDEVELDGRALLLTQAGDRLYIAAGSTVLVIDTDDNALLDPIELDTGGGVIPVASPDGRPLYVIDQQFGRISVVDTDPANTATYHTVIDEIGVTDPPVVVDNGDGTSTGTAQFPISAAFNADGTRMYVVRNGQTYTQDGTTYEVTDFRYSGEIVTIDLTTNEVVGAPLPIQGDYGYFASSDGRYLYVPVLTMNGFDPTVFGGDISPITGSVNVIDVQDPDNPVIVAELATGNLPVNVAFSPDGSVAYVVDAGGGTVYVIDTVNQEVLDLDPVAEGVQGLVFDAEPTATLGAVFNVIASSPDGTQLFVTNFSKGTVIPLEFVRDTV
ncbi:cadherin-like domain-containing protein [Mycolicibacterium flavescens]|uniref:Cadherin domain-containing protein n=1 Tax=Mycolicibacterium flavescens TaxID=1776 RepID=A0A1E3RMH0_MYCFV|nr:Ig-like domain-containing protein [Mycolicibacterium flavescens]MCV7281454.1 cadherin-like domain-containing protein [Mycolicibacterium flavescens]ODQ91048.1 hypothetical protein BHQ18_06485 [Mycolicibacterium flavescens]